MELIFLFLWGLLRSGEADGHGNGKCSTPHYIEFAEITIDRVMVGSKVRYMCEAGYRRIIGKSNLIVCTNDTGLIHWTTKASVCEQDSRATSQPSERKPEYPVTIVPSDTAGYCGIPSPVEHTTPRVTEYAVGQELHYKCLRGYDARPPTSDISTCKEEHGKTFWTRPSLLCTNDSKSEEEMTRPIPITDTSELFHVPSLMFPVTGKCFAPHYIEFAEITIDRVMVGSKVRYMCEAGYRRIIGKSNFIVCTNDTGLIHWTTKASVCERDSSATSQPSERKPEYPVTILPSDTAGYCGIPSPVEHTTPRVTEYAVGQELHYKCLRGYDARPPTSDISTCKEEHGKTFWTRPSLLCTNDSKSEEEMTRLIPITDTSELFHVPSLMFPVTGKCFAPHYIEFAEITIDRVMVGSKVRYMCEAGYRRIIGKSNFIVCTNDTGLIHWTTKASVCERDSWATSQPSKRKPENPVTIVPSDTAGYCGIPSPVEHTTPRVTEYAVGQELHYKCLRGYDARPPTSDISTCKEEHGKTFWTRPSLLCTNDSKSEEEMTRPIPITVAVSTVFPIIFIILGWIIVSKLWRRRSLTEDVKIEKTKSILITAASVEMESEEEAHRLKSNM
ncbi:interleukin-2 receptor subunit alpha isoform X4 [Mauremys reevesii]|uniref:interleukin-2 receptor subunit alpha isoform X4 n=1 Tax=Mauremys reevesii TaxID=260615 RepID=UPI00193EDFBE|nr:interleukin-2 receptor subunit alpha isoform X4 [Mauremys reevesii]